MTESIVILAGGASSRMKKPDAQTTLNAQLTKQSNRIEKGLIEVLGPGKSLVYFLLQNIRVAGFKKVYFVVGNQSQRFQKQFENHPDFKMLKTFFAIQHIPKSRTKPLGTADALFQVMEQFPELKEQSFLVCNSDNLYSIFALKALKNCQHNNAFAAYDRDHLLYPQEKLAGFAIAALDQNQVLIDILEKPNVDQLETFKDSSGKIRVSMNLFKFEGKSIFPHLKACPINLQRDEKELPTALKNMIKKQNISVFGVSIQEHVPDLSSKADILSFQNYIKHNENPQHYDD